LDKLGQRCPLMVGDLQAHPPSLNYSPTYRVLAVEILERL
jgi:hypothetical protein